MELREFAEQVLWGTTLEEKLRRPDQITDEHPGSPIVAPELPGRPARLVFKPHEAHRSGFPSIQRLEHEPERGRLLHFFANHELLATELMALVLLRFPEAPSAFRRGVFETLLDEQIHTRWYCQRMEKCGIEFGDLPVSGFFWRTVSRMESPIDFVAGLSLTFEQANLDFCGHFAAAFRTVGDETSAKILDRIYHDEIGHVAHGWKWFQRWKNPTDSDWDAFCRHLKFPLSPQRAKGFHLNVAGRRAAGLGSDFIEELNVFSQSKGRTPSVFLFNPFTEAYLARGPHFTPRSHSASLARDLAMLPQFLAGADDVVLVPRRPSVHWLSLLKCAGFPLPEFIECSGPLPPNHPLRKRKLGDLRPWAWGPDSLALLRPLVPNVSTKARHSLEDMSDELGTFPDRLASLYSKAWSAGKLSEWLADAEFVADDASWLCASEEVGRSANSFNEVLDAVAAIRSRGHREVIVKGSFGLAGQSALRLREPDLQLPQRRWLERAVERGPVVVEPWLERIVDFSVHGERRRNGLELRGYVGLLTDPRGHYTGNWAEPQSRRHPPAEVVEALRQVPRSRHRLEQLYARLFDRLERELTVARFFGPVGVDAFVYRDAMGTARLKPVVEINPRFTMGRLTLELMRYVSPGSSGHFRLVNRAQLRDEGLPDFVSYATSVRDRFPLRMAGNPVARILSGAVCLTDPSIAEEYVAVFRVIGKQ